MRFQIEVDYDIVLMFEPTAREYSLRAGEIITVEWFDGTEQGMVRLTEGVIEVSATVGGYTRAWDSQGVEIYVGPESGDESRI